MLDALIVAGRILPSRQQHGSATNQADWRIFKENDISEIMTVNRLTWLEIMSQLYSGGPNVAMFGW